MITVRVLVAASLVATCASLKAAGYECTAVEKKATVYSNQAVSVSSDSSSKTCTFSVGGATAKEAPPEVAARIAALSRDFAMDPKSFYNAMGRLRDQGDGSMRTYIELLLAATAPNGTLPDVASSKLSDNTSRNALKECARDFTQDPSGTSRTGTAGFQCQASRVEVAPGQRVNILSITITDGSRRWSLALPHY